MLRLRGQWDARRLGATTFGFFLWLQLAAGPLSRELSYVDPDPRRLVVYLLPLAFLTLTALRPFLVISLLFFPTSFGAVLVVSPPALEEALFEPLTFGLVALTLIAYVMTTGAVHRPLAQDPLLDVSRAPVRVPYDRWRPYRGTTVPRVVLVVVAFLITVAAVPLLPDLSANVARSFGASDPLGTAAGLVLCKLIIFFMWCVLAYAIFITPAVELEARTRRLETRLEASLAGARTPRRRVAFGGAVAAALALMVALLVLRYT